MSFSLSASIVVFDSDPELLRRTLESLATAIVDARRAGLLGSARITLVDNGAPAGTMVDEAFAAAPQFSGETGMVWRRIAGQGNIGFGRGHNLAMHDGIISRRTSLGPRLRGDDKGGRVTDADIHLVLNPDALLAADALTLGLAWLRDTPACGMAAPYGAGPDGAPLFLCKRYPDLLTLLLRAAAPAALRQRFARRLARYELRDIVGERGERPAEGVPLASGCCMLLRREALQHANGFDPSYFVYFEDYDLSLRLAHGAGWRIDYLPRMRLVHFGGNAARKSWRHVRLFAAGAIRFFSRHGWKFA